MDDQLLKKYFAGKCTVDEKRQVESFLHETENLGDTLDNPINDLWENGKDFSKGEIFSGVLFNEIQSKLNDSKDSGHSSSIHVGRSQTFRSILKYAAVVTVVSFAAFFVSKNYKQESNQEVARVETVVKRTSNGQKSTILLSDGSKVILNSGSSLSYPRHFSDSSRTLKLKGEAYFEVAKDVSRPFSVIANGIRTTALGTSFNINAVGVQTKVSLATGKVVVKEDQVDVTQEALYFLSPGEAIQFTKGSKEISKEIFNYQQDFLWKDGILYFENASFNEIQNRLSKWYDVQFTIKNDRLSQKRYTGQFNNETLKNVLENMAFSLGFDYFLNGKKVELIFNERTKN